MPLQLSKLLSHGAFLSILNGFPVFKNQNKGFYKGNESNLNFLSIKNNFNGSDNENEKSINNHQLLPSLDGIEEFLGDFSNEETTDFQFESVTDNSEVISGEELQDNQGMLNKELMKKMQKRLSYIDEKQKLQEEFEKKMNDEIKRIQKKKRMSISTKNRDYIPSIEDIIYETKIKFEAKKLLKREHDLIKYKKKIEEKLDEIEVESDSNFFINDIEAKKLLNEDENDSDIYDVFRTSEDNDIDEIIKEEEITPGFEKEDDQKLDISLPLITGNDIQSNKDGEFMKKNNIPGFQNISEREYKLSDNERKIKDTLKNNRKNTITSDNVYNEFESLSKEIKPLSDSDKKYIEGIIKKNKNKHDMPTSNRKINKYHDIKDNTEDKKPTSKDKKSKAEEMNVQKLSSIDKDKEINFKLNLNDPPSQIISYLIKNSEMSISQAIKFAIEIFKRKYPNFSKEDFFDYFLYDELVASFISSYLKRKKRQTDEKKKEEVDSAYNEKLEVTYSKYLKSVQKDEANKYKDIKKLILDYSDIIFDKKKYENFLSLSLCDEINKFANGFLDFSNRSAESNCVMM